VDEVSYEAKREQGAMGESTTAFIGSRREESRQEALGHRQRWDFDGVIGFKAEKKREGSQGGVNLMGETKRSGRRAISATRARRRATHGGTWSGGAPRGWQRGWATRGGRRPWVGQLGHKAALGRMQPGWFRWKTEEYEGRPYAGVGQE
jgi:hypothetical protein